MSNSTSSNPTETPDAAPVHQPLRVLIPFNTVALYGMERGVMEIFASLRPAVEPHFVLTRTAQRLDLPVYHAILEHGFSHSFFSDYTSWPKIGLPRSPGQLAEMLKTLWIGNQDVLRASRDQDVLYVASIHYQMYAVLAARAIRRRGGRVLFHFHDLGVEGIWARLAAWMRGLLTQVIHNTEFSRQLALARVPQFGALPQTIIPFSCTVRPVPPDPAVVEQLALTTNLFYIGRMSISKGIDILLEALDRVLPDYPHVRLQIVGDMADPASQARCEELMARRNLQGKCVLWGFRHDVSTFLSHAYAYVQPSRPSMVQESFGRGAVEAMSFGVPTVCLESGALQTIVRDGETGLVCHEETPEALASSLRALLDDPALRDRMGAACRVEYAAEYDPERVRRRWLSLLEIAG